MHWRKKFDLDGYIPTLGTKLKLIAECEAIERNEIVKECERKDNNDNNNKNRNSKNGKFAAKAGKDDHHGNGQFYCKNCGRNLTHDTSKCFFPKDKTQRFEKKILSSSKEASKKDRPFSHCTFRKEVNTLLHKASKKNALGLYASALKRQKDKESKAKQAKRHAIESKDSLSSKDSISVNNLGKPIPRKTNYKLNIARAVTKTKPNKKDNKKDNKKGKKEEEDIGFLSAFKKMQIDDDYEMLDGDDDVLLLDEEEVSIASEDI
jgi:hypothetical protein